MLFLSNDGALMARIQYFLRIVSESQVIFTPDFFCLKIGVDSKCFQVSKLTEITKERDH